MQIVTNMQTTKMNGIHQKSMLKCLGSFTISGYIILSKLIQHRTKFIQQSILKSNSWIPYLGDLKGKKSKWLETNSSLKKIYYTWQVKMIKIVFKSFWIDWITWWCLTKNKRSQQPNYLALVSCLLWTTVSLWKICK